MSQVPKLLNRAAPPIVPAVAAAPPDAPTVAAAPSHKVLVMVVLVAPPAGPASLPEVLAAPLPA